MLVKKVAVCISVVNLAYLWEGHMFEFAGCQFYFIRKTAPLKKHGRDRTQKGTGKKSAPSGEEEKAAPHKEWKAAPPI